MLPTNAATCEDNESPSVASLFGPAPEGDPFADDEIESAASLFGGSQPSSNELPNDFFGKMDLKDQEPEPVANLFGDQDDDAIAELVGSPQPFIPPPSPVIRQGVSESPVPVMRPNQGPSVYVPTSAPSPSPGVYVPSVGVNPNKNVYVPAFRVLDKPKQEVYVPNGASRAPIPPREGTNARAASPLSGEQGLGKQIFVPIGQKQDDKPKYTAPPPFARPPPMPGVAAAVTTGKEQFAKPPAMNVQKIPEVRGATTTSFMRPPPMNTQQKTPEIAEQAKAPQPMSFMKPPPMNTQQKTPEIVEQTKAPQPMSFMKPPPMNTQQKTPEIAEQTKAPQPMSFMKPPPMNLSKPTTETIRQPESQGAVLEQPKVATPSEVTISASNPLSDDEKDLTQGVSEISRPNYEESESDIDQKVEASEGVDELTEDSLNKDRDSKLETKEETDKLFVEPENPLEEKDVEAADASNLFGDASNSSELSKEDTSQQGPETHDIELERESAQDLFTKGDDDESASDLLPQKSSQSSGTSSIEEEIEPNSSLEMTDLSREPASDETKIGCPSSVSQPPPVAPTKEIDERLETPHPAAPMNIWKPAIPTPGSMDESEKKPSEGSVALTVSEDEKPKLTTPTSFKKPPPMAIYKPTMPSATSETKPSSDNATSTSVCEEEKAKVAPPPTFTKPPPMAIYKPTGPPSVSSNAERITQQMPSAVELPGQTSKPYIPGFTGAPPPEKTPVSQTPALDNGNSAFDAIEDDLDETSTSSVQKNIVEQPPAHVEPNQTGKPYVPFVPQFGPEKEPKTSIPETSNQEPEDTPTIPLFTPAPQIPPVKTPDQNPTKETETVNEISPQELHKLAEDVIASSRGSTRPFRERAQDLNSIERRFCDGLSHVTSTSDLLATLESHGVKRAIDQCVDNEDWATSLLLATSVSREEFDRVVRLFIGAKFGNDDDTASALLTISGNTGRTWQSTLRNSLLFETHTALRKEAVQQQNYGNTEATDTIKLFLSQPLAKPRTTAPSPTTTRQRRSLVTDDMFLDEVPSAPQSPQKPAPPKPVAQKPPSPQKPPEPEPKPQEPKEKTEEQQESRGWFGGFFKKLNPFASRPSKTVDLSEHEGEEMVWNGSRYVVKGHEHEEETAPPPPPPAAKHSPSTETQPPAALGPRTGKRTRAAGRYVNSF